MQWALKPEAAGTLHHYLGVPKGQRLPDVSLIKLRNNKSVPVHVRRRADVVLKMRGWRFSQGPPQRRLKGTKSIQLFYL